MMQETLPITRFLKTGPRHPAFSVPESDPTFWVPEDVSRFLATVHHRSEQGERVNALLVGPTGTGKSSLPRECAALWGRPFFSMHCQLVTEQGDWWGLRQLSNDQGTYFDTAALVDAIETPGCVVLLDEANRTHPENLNALFGLLDHRRSAWVPALQREVVVAPGVVFFVTVNRGLEYVGTNSVDKAMRDRISNTVFLSFPPQEVEASLLTQRTRVSPDSAKRLVRFATTVRGNRKVVMSVSTRQLLECAALIAGGLALNEAVRFAVVNGAEEETERTALLQALQMSDVQSAGLRRIFEDDDR